MTSPRIVGVEWAALEGVRPRRAGCNARLGIHGSSVRVPIVRITSDDGVSGFGYSRAGKDLVDRLLGRPLDDLMNRVQSLDPTIASVEYPLLDLYGRLVKRPVYELAAEAVNQEAPRDLSVRCYDTSLYIDDLDLKTTDAAAKLIADEALQGYDRGHRAFKLKVGRGARHMPLEEGTVRDIAVIRAVSRAVGSGCTIMIDANNGYNLNLTKRVLLETADCNLHWIEEPFHEDAVLYQDLRVWLSQQKLSVLIADGEGDASLRLLDWTREGLIDVVQYDIMGHGFYSWLRTGRQLDAASAGSAPHSYGNCYGNFVSGHLAAGIKGFTAVEWDEASVPGLDTSRYQVNDGYVKIPPSPGFGLDLDDKLFMKAVQDSGGSAWI